MKSAASLPRCCSLRSRLARILLAPCGKFPPPPSNIQACRLSQLPPASLRGGPVRSGGRCLRRLRRRLQSVRPQRPARPAPALLALPFSPPGFALRSLGTASAGRFLALGMVRRPITTVVVASTLPPYGGNRPGGPAGRGCNETVVIRRRLRLRLRLRSRPTGSLARHPCRAGSARFAGLHARPSGAGVAPPGLPPPLRGGNAAFGRRVPAFGRHGAIAPPGLLAAFGRIAGWPGSMRFPGTALPLPPAAPGQHRSCRWNAEDIRDISTRHARCLVPLLVPKAPFSPRDPPRYRKYALTRQRGGPRRSFAVRRR